MENSGRLAVLRGSCKRTPAGLELYKNMPDLEWNLAYWNDSYEWPGHGEEWSEQWGNSRVQWLSCVLPRIAAHLPADSLIEIAPGQGRWTRFLLDQCRSYRGFDIAENTVEFCRTHLSNTGLARERSFEVNDGSSLPGVEDQSIDYVFSLDSLVHVEMPVLSSYITEVARVLKPGGAAFIHHSNMAHYAEQETGDLWNPHCRAESVSAMLVRKEAERAGLNVPIQECITFNHHLMQDCFSTLRKPESDRLEETTVIENEHFWDEAAHARKTLLPYLQGSQG